MKDSVRAVMFVLALGAASSCASKAPEVPVTSRIQIDDLARQLADSTAQRPVLLHVGFAPLYRSGHIPGSRALGAGNTDQGLSALRQSLEQLPANRQVVLYCGCCPWKDCPNVRPAYEVAKKAGRGDVRVLYVPDNFERDWINRGLPSVAGEE